jgi:hypothetical protein
MAISVYQQGGYGTAPLFPEPIVAPRAPTTNDRVSPSGQPYQVFQGWNNSLTDTNYIYLGAGNWVTIAAITGSVTQLTGDSGTATPTAGSIQIAGTVNQIVTSGALSAITLSLPSAVQVTTSVTTASFITSSATLGTTYTANQINATGSDANISLLINPKGTGGVIHSRSSAGNDINFQATNADNTNAASRASFQTAVGGTSAGDPYFQSLISGGQVFSWGIDNSSANDDWVLSKNASLGTSNQLVVDGSTGALSTVASVTAATSLTATLGNITATNGNLVLGTAGNKLQIATGANASVGTATLVGGTVTVSTTAVTASSLIMLTRQSIGATGAAALGVLTVGTVVDGVSFDINAVQAADATALQATDVSVIGWQIIN